MHRLDHDQKTLLRIGASASEDLCADESQGCQGISLDRAAVMAMSASTSARVYL